MNNPNLKVVPPIQRTPEEQIAELARGVPKPSDKAMAFAALRRIIEHADDEARGRWTNIDGDTALDLARLYAHFLPRPGKRAKTPFEWVAKAVAGTNDPRHYLRFVYVTEGEIVATDGHSLHIAPNPGADYLTPGYYGTEGVRLHALDYATYPNYQRVQPDPEARGRGWYQRRLDDLPLKTKEMPGNKTMHYYELPVGNECSDDRVHIDARLLQRLVSMDPDENMIFNTGSMGDSVLVQLKGRRKAVVMPLRQ